MFVRAFIRVRTFFNEMFIHIACDLSETLRMNDLDLLQTAFRLLDDAVGTPGSILRRKTPLRHSNCMSSFVESRTLTFYLLTPTVLPFYLLTLAVPPSHSLTPVLPFHLLTLAIPLFHSLTLVLPFHF